MTTNIKLSENAFLRHFTLADAPEIFNLIDNNREFLSEFLEWPRKTKTVDDSIWFINRTQELLKEDINIFAVIFEGKIAGVVSYNNFDKANKRAPIGYWLGKKFQGNGLITMSVRALIDFGFKEMGLNRIEINCATENIPSQKIAERLGFELEGIARAAEIIGGKVLDHKVYSLVK